MTQSILEQAFIDSILSTARMNVERDEHLDPVLFLHLGGQKVEILPLVYPQSSQAKQAYFAQLGAHLYTAGKLIEEAVFLAETWIVLATKAPAAFAVQPSQHPSRQEAIVVVGRDAFNARQTFVVQPFTRAAKHKPVWESLAMASYNAPVTKGIRAVGLLDYLFAANQRK